jgi:hypothetical protein
MHMARRISALLMYRPYTLAEIRLVKLVEQFDKAVGNRPGFKCPPAKTLPQARPMPATEVKAA